LNDEDIYPDMKEPAAIRTGLTDLSIHLVRCQTWKFARVMQGLTPNAVMGVDASDHRILYERRLETIRDFRSKFGLGSTPLLDTFTLDKSSGLEFYVSTTVHLLTDRVELMVHYQFAVAERQGMHIYLLFRFYIVALLLPVPT
jgi:hypothetical protein